MDRLDTYQQLHIDLSEYFIKEEFPLLSDGQERARRYYDDPNVRERVMINIQYTINSLLIAERLGYKLDKELKCQP